MSNISIEKARDSSLNKIVYQYELDDEDRLNENYECTECNNKLSVHKNKNDLYYFKHPKDTCIDNLSSNKELINLHATYYRSGRHNEYENKLVKFLEKRNFSNIEKEKSFYVDGKVKHRADIYFEDMKHKFVIEVQISPLAFNQILKRIDFYKSQGIYLLWVVDIGYIDRSAQQFLKDILGYSSQYKEIFSLNHLGEMIVHYQEIFYSKKANKIWEKNKSVRINIYNLTYNEKDMTVCYYNREKKRKEINRDNPMLLINHIGVGYFLSDSDDILVKKLNYYEKYYALMPPKFLELIDAIFLQKYQYEEEEEYYDICLFLIKSDMIKTLRFLLNYGRRRREMYKPKIDEKNYYLLRSENILIVRNELVYYYFLEENIPNNSSNIEITILNPYGIE